jgi:membrane complex biogenesis BtpA family protein
MLKNALIGMVHVGALPGAHRARSSVAELTRQAVLEANVLHDAGYDALILENMHDAPYVNGPHDPAVVAAMAMVAGALRQALPRMAMGIQVLSRGEREALAIAHACGLQFVRCENFVFAHVADEGLLPDAAAGPLLRYRRAIGAEGVKVFADIQKKHASHAITNDLDVAELAKGAEFFCADGVIVTGVATGEPTSTDDVVAARRATKLPILVGSGVTPEQVPVLLRHADALIVGSWIKQGGVWHQPVDAQRAKQLAAMRGK